MRSRFFSGLSKVATALLVTIGAASMAGAAPPAGQTSNPGNGSVAGALSDVSTYFLSAHTKVKGAKVKGINAKSAKSKTIKRFRFPDKIAAKFPGLPQEWMVEGYPASQAEYTAERVKLADKKKHAKRAKIKNKNSPVDRKLKKEKDNKDKNKNNQTN